MKHLGAIMILITIIIVPALGYTLKKVSEHGEKIAVNTSEIAHGVQSVKGIKDDIKEMRSDVKDLLKAQGVKSSYEEKRE
jgi:hypothetical protein